MYNNYNMNAINPYAPGAAQPAPVPNPYGAANYNPYPNTAGYQSFSVNSQKFPINPQVLALIKPIIEQMTEYESYKRATPHYGMWNPMNSVDEDRKRKFELAKKQCVHLYRNPDSKQLEPSLEEVNEEKFKCKLCGREIYKKFDETATKKIEDAIAVLNMLAFFGMSLNLGPNEMSTVIFLKQTLPEANNLVGVLNKFVTEENSAIQTVNNIGGDHQGATFRNITQYGF